MVQALSPVMPETKAPQPILAESIQSISDHKSNPSKTVKIGKTVAVLKNNKPEFYVVSPERMKQIKRIEDFMEAIEDQEDLKLVMERRNGPTTRITLEDLSKL